MAGIHLIEKKRWERREPIPLRRRLGERVSDEAGRADAAGAGTCRRSFRGLLTQWMGWLARLLPVLREESGEVRLRVVEGGRAGRKRAERGRGGVRPFLVFGRTR